MTWYIVAEILKIFVVALIALTLLILLIGVARTLLREGLGPLAIIQLLPYVLPIALQFSFPATALFAVCCVYGRMASDGEIAAIKASGVSPLRLVSPAFVLAALLSPISVGLSDLAVSWGRPGVNRIVMLSIEDIVYRTLRAQHTYADGDHGFSIYVHDVSGKSLIAPRVTIKSGSRPMKISAREGRLTMDAQSESLMLQLVDCRFDQSGTVTGIMPGTTDYEIPLSGSLSRSGPGTTRPQELPLRLLDDERVYQESQTRTIAGTRAAQVGFSIMTSRLDEIGGITEVSVANQLRASRERLVRLKLEPWRRWAEGCSCFFFVLIGAPLAMIAKTSDYWTTFGICFLPILLIYYPLFILGLEQAKDANIPPYGVWLGNVLLGTIGVILLARVRRY
ncbi:LptF/LptG family permease [Stieleria varia]|uniref:Putative permease YjgP/YjgQ family protein n=2 Tax=Stieleria varia TaxID=2528005 RepID=A0A5C6AQP3_9BACT|nr:LptF/LptG family permease [Stieleria varia]TWU02275.1 putative permease YjgP/YjgQ family protein [Stieleria varia]